MDDATGNIVNAILALLGIAATLFLAFNARSGSRHRVDNIKLATETLGKTEDPKAREMIARFIAREAAKLEDSLHPQTREARKWSMWAAGYYLVGTGFLIYANWMYGFPFDLQGWLSFAPGGFAYLGAGLCVLLVAPHYRAMRSRRHDAARALDEPFRMDDWQREERRHS